MVKLFEIPPQSEQELRDAFGSDLQRAAIEALAIIGYCSGKLSLLQIGRLLGFDSRWKTEQWLGDREISWNYSLEDLESDRITLANLFTNENQ